MKIKYFNFPLVYILILGAMLTSCKKFLKLDAPHSVVTDDVVFNNDVTATSAVIGIYHQLVNSMSFSSGSANSVSVLAGLSSDELLNFNELPEYLEFQKNEIRPINANITNLWSSLYKVIYQSNVVLEGISNSSGMTDSIKQTLRGEAFFLRAFANFYLTNLFGAVPIVKTTDYSINNKLSRSNVPQVYGFIISDLEEAVKLLPDNYQWVDQDYITGARIRATKDAALALLSRTYLYLGDYQMAEENASKLILKTSRYQLLHDIDAVFLSNSSESIWQLRSTSPSPAGNTQEGATFLAPLGLSTYCVLNNSIIDAFEEGDKREIHWVKGYQVGTSTIYVPFKYKIYQDIEIKEYSSVFRIAEQYLIRAEARIKLNKIGEAISDLNAIRQARREEDYNPNDNYFPLPDLTISITPQEAFDALTRERRVELFSEWGHRWFDLKRWRLSTSVLSATKQNWNDDDILYPVPQIELDRNRNLLPQNNGY